ncbi:MAG: biotin--[acetyl-CoA-carboxylase] ligase [Ruminococcaceae bacterium]|nr:biotin--[acetyl-CoA-carboxylase] ligase [Oscillospiraceae bacterium]
MPLTYKLIEFSELNSTNIYAKELARAGEAEGTLVTAQSQSEGYGRMGRKFYSPDSSGLYASLILRPKTDCRKALLVTTAACVAVSEAIDKLSGKRSGIKWVNDIYIGSKKVCGILCESAISKNNGLLDYLILGIGVNLYEPQNGFEDDIKGIAGAVFGSEYRKEMKTELQKEIFDNFARYYEDLGSREIYCKYREKCFIIGQKVNVIKNGAVFEHTVCDIDESFRLITKNDSGEYYLHDSGEVSLKCNI